MIRGKTIGLDLFKTTNKLAVSTLIFIPIVYLFVMYFVQLPERHGGETEILQYILLIVGILQPLTIPLITRVQIRFWQQSKLEKKSPASLFFSLALIRFPLVLAIYIYGLVVYFLSGDIIKAIYFYPIGITWSVVHWPTRGRFENFISRLSER